MESQKKTTATNPLAKPRFQGDREKLVEIVDGKPGTAEHLREKKLIPYSCFSDPDLESGVCNPLLPLKDGEPHLCALYKSCLIAKLLSRGIKVDFMDARERPYEEILAEADQLFDHPPEEDTPATEDDRDRHVIRGQVLSISLQPPVNPFRRNSIRRFALDVLSRDWVSFKDLKAILTTSKHGVRRLDLIIHQVTSIATQEQFGYRIVESMGKYKAFRR